MPMVGAGYLAGRRHIRGGSSPSSSGPSHHGGTLVSRASSAPVPAEQADPQSSEDHPDNASGRWVDASEGVVDASVSPQTLRVLSLLSTSWVLLDRSDKIVGYSEGIVPLGLMKDVELRHSQLRDLVRETRRRSSTLETHLALPRGPIDAARVDLHIRIGTLSDELILILVDDQTQARRIEETRRDFVVNVSHELKTPVGGLRLLAEAVEDAADDPDAVARFASRMKTETVRLASLVQEIVDLSRLQGSDAIASAKPVDLGECAVRAADELRLIAEDREIDIQLSVGEGDHVVMGDSNLLTTAIRNLASNALNYSEQHTRVQVAVSREGDDIIVEVADQGIGMTADEVERIFERFYRVDPARSRRTGGTGLGLAIVKHVCANHGGEIRVWSEPGVGSTFVMQIPARVPARPARPSAAAARSGDNQVKEDK